MKRLFLLLTCLLALVFAAPAGLAADAAPAAADNNSPNAAEHDRNTVEAAAAVGSGAVQQNVRPPDFLEHLVDSILELFNVRSSGNTVTHYTIAIVLLLCGFLLRRVVTGIIFSQLKKLAS